MNEPKNDTELTLRIRAVRSAVFVKFSAPQVPPFYDKRKKIGTTMKIMNAINIFIILFIKENERVDQTMVFVNIC